MGFIEVTQKVQEEKKKTAEKHVKAQEDLEKVADTIVHSDFMRERLEMLSSFFWAKKATGEGEKGPDGKAKPAELQKPSDAWICFKNTIKFTRGLYGWPQEAVANWAALLMRWQGAIEDGAEVMASECCTLAYQISALYLSVGITDEDKHGEYGIIRVGPKQFDKEPQKLL
jgi:hypothetical protein